MEHLAPIIGIIKNGGGLMEKPPLRYVGSGMSFVQRTIL